MSSKPRTQRSTKIAEMRKYVGEPLHPSTTLSHVTLAEAEWLGNARLVFGYGPYLYAINTRRTGTPATPKEVRDAFTTLKTRMAQYVEDAAAGSDDALQRGWEYLPAIKDMAGGY